MSRKTVLWEEEGPFAATGECFLPADSDEALIACCDHKNKLGEAIRGYFLRYKAKTVQVACCASHNYQIARTREVSVKSYVHSNNGNLNWIYTLQNGLLTKPW